MLNQCLENMGEGLLHACISSTTHNLVCKNLYRNRRSEIADHILPVATYTIRLKLVINFPPGRVRQSASRLQIFVKLSEITC